MEEDDGFLHSLVIVPKNKKFSSYIDISEEYDFFLDVHCLKLVLRIYFEDSKLEFTTDEITSFKENLFKEFKLLKDVKCFEDSFKIRFILNMEYNDSSNLTTKFALRNNIRTNLEETSCEKIKKIIRQVKSTPGKQPLEEEELPIEICFVKYSFVY